MLDICILLMTAINSGWIETDPAKANLKYSYDEYDPNNPKLQINLTHGTSKSIWLMKNVYRIEHECKVTIFLGPDSKDTAIIAALRVTFNKMKTQIDTILGTKFGITGITDVELTGWRDEDIEIGFDTVPKPKEPIIWKSTQIVKCVYYIGAIT